MSIVASTLSLSTPGANLHRLGLLLRAMDRHAEAAPLLQEVLATRRKLLGDEHPAVARTLEALTRVRLERQRNEAR